MQEIQADEQEFESSANSDDSDQSRPEPSKTPPKSAFSSPSSGKEVRVDLRQLDRSQLYIR